MPFDGYLWLFSHLGLVSVFSFFNMETQKISIWENKTHRRFSVTVITMIILVHQWKKYKSFDGKCRTKNITRISNIPSKPF